MLQSIKRPNFMPQPDKNLKVGSHTSVWDSICIREVEFLGVEISKREAKVGMIMPQNCNSESTRKRATR
jgi:hypothetical protein